MYRPGCKLAHDKCVQGEGKIAKGIEYRAKMREFHEWLISIKIRLNYNWSSITLVSYKGIFN